MKKSLKSHFPMIRSKEEIRLIIKENLQLEELFQSWDMEQQKEFLEFCSGNKGVRILYDSFFKEILSPENAPERLNELLSLILGQQVKILQVLPNDSTRIADESSLVIMDIVVELEDHSIANVEVQKIGYKFSGQNFQVKEAPAIQQIFSCASINVYGEKGEGRLAIGIFRKYIQLCFLKRVRKNCEKTKRIVSTVLRRYPIRA